ncbi:L-threonylcarbamoyladenylate synthase [Stratiformator vulcanicus]|uniref:Threonylcarbamoyl-AMP synthase n=1 Tax=Stratiformator vulcanicus TaxID=2527980 RepID=A0A517R3G5_9PLAN|nr:L-threonylcarbamoyladenylate synthase [Stratiformator vulcanicus]QDT38414.1 Threonylcarbamoyl-AMP synthase [Stratiformator vulcanicus]
MPCPIGTDVIRAAALLREGGLVAFGTETVYGLGANALDPLAVAKIFAAKQRPKFDPLIVHVSNAATARELVSDWPDRATRLSEKFWPGPLTIVLPKRECVPDLVSSGLSTVGVRVPAPDLARELLKAAGVPVAAPSANPFGRISPTTAAHVAESLGGKIDYILDGGPCTVGIESTVLSLAVSTPQLLRPGGITREEIESVIGPFGSNGDGTRRGPAPSPGMLSKHYAPRKPLSIVTSFSQIDEPTRSGLLLLGPVERDIEPAALEQLSSEGDLTVAAASFYGALRRLDASSAERIYAFPFPDVGLGIALNDRLNRAAAGSGDREA